MTTNQTNPTEQPEKSFKEKYGIEPEDYIRMSKDERDDFINARFKIDHPAAYWALRGFAYLHLLFTVVNTMLCVHEFCVRDWKQLVWTAPISALLIYQRVHYSWCKVKLPGGFRV